MYPLSHLIYLNRRFFSLVFCVFLCLVSVTSAHANLLDSLSNKKDGPLPVSEAYQVRVEQVGSGRVDLVWQIQPDYYLYLDKISVVPGEGLSLVDRRAAPSVTKDDPLFGQVEVYYDEARLNLLIGSTDGRDSGEIEVTYQGCWEGGICYPPVTETLALAGLSSSAGLQWDDAGAGESGAMPPKSAGTSEQDQFAELLRGASLWVVLGAFFLAGLALSLTPCVFPMIPILSGIIVGHGHRMTTPRAFMLSLVYVLAMALTYTLAGVVVGLFGANVQAALQNVWVIAVFAGLFVALALSMFGFYELQMPRWLQTRVTEASAHQKGGSLSGVAVMGVLSALIVGPCMAAPLAGALIYIGQAGDPVLGGLALFVLSLGMGVPLLVVGASAGRLLPRAGAWMEGVKAAFGVVLLLMAVWMLDRVVPTQVSMALAGIILVVSAVYLNVFERLGDHAGGWHRLWKGVGLVLLVYGAALLIGVLAGGRSLVYPLQRLAANGAAVDVKQGNARTSLDFFTVTRLSQLEPLLAQARRDGQPVMLDFYADWCVSCIELEYVTFADPGVQERLASFKLIKVDVTANDEDSKALNRRYQVFGPPVLLFHDINGQERPEMTMVGVIEPERFLSTIASL